jgi:hypothetical protein
MRRGGGALRSLLKLVFVPPPRYERLHQPVNGPARQSSDLEEDSERSKDMLGEENQEVSNEGQTQDALSARHEVDRFHVWRPHT